MMEPASALRIWFCILLGVLVLGIVGALVTTFMKRRSSNKSGLLFSSSVVGGISLYLSYDSPLLKLTGFGIEARASEVIEELRQTANWLIESAHACGCFIGSKQRFYVMGFFGTEELGSPPNRRELFVEALTNLFNAVIPLENIGPEAFELEFLACPPEESFELCIQNAQCRYALPTMMACYRPDTVIFEQPRPIDTEVETPA